MTNLVSQRQRVAVFPVHRPARSIHNHGMIGSSAIVKRGAVAAGSAGGIGAIIAMFCGALTLLHVARTAAARQAELRARRLHALRRAIVGVRKHQVAAVLGHPRATIGRGDYRTDDTWYYAIDTRRHVALAIKFADGIARQTQVIAGM